MTAREDVKAALSMVVLNELGDGVRWTPQLARIGTAIRRALEDALQKLDEHEVRQQDKEG